MKALRQALLLISLVLLPVLSFVQSTDTQPDSGPAPKPVRHEPFVKDLVRDQKAIWASPFHLKKEDARWLVPLAAVTAGLIIADRHTTAWVDPHGSLQPISHHVSFAGSAYVVMGSATGLYLFGRASHNPHTQQTGKLMTEAILGTALVTEVIKFATERQRPNEGSGTGPFFVHGRAFPSGHSSSSWAAATVLAMRYRHDPWIRYGAFAVVTAIGIARYSGRSHFMSDVVVGSAIGYGIGRFVSNNR